MSERGLREIKKEATAQALAQSAFELALEHGVDGLLIDDVVERAGYSRRTFANHFSCKEEAIASVLFSGAIDGEDFILGLPESTSLIDALHALVKRQLSAEKLEQLRNLVSLCHEYPSLQSYLFASVAEAGQATVATFMEHAKGRYSEQYVKTLFAMAYGALTLLFDENLGVLALGESDANGTGTMSFEELVDNIFKHLRTGF